MTQKNYHEQTAELIESAFKDLGNAMSNTTTEERAGHTAIADLKIKAAQAVATLAHARETRVLAIATLAGLDPREVDQRGDLPREAYAAAAVALGLVEDQGADGDLSMEELREALGAEDPADKDMGDLP